MLEVHTYGVSVVVLWSSDEDFLSRNARRLVLRSFSCLVRGVSSAITAFPAVRTISANLNY